MIRSLDHLVLRVADLDAALHFYGEILGMQVRRFGAERVALHCGAQKIELQSLGSESQAQAPQPQAHPHQRQLNLRSGEVRRAFLAARWCQHGR